MNTKLIAAVAVLVILFTSCATTGSGTRLSLYDAIGQTGEKIAGELPKGSRVAIVAFESMNDNLSDYIMEELTGELFDRGIEVADRQNLEYVYKELNLQMSGDVSDESAKSIGKFLAADMVITGQLLDLDGMYRYRTSAINVETAVRASVTRLNVRSDNETRRMITALANQQTSVKVAKYGVSADVTPQTAGTFLDRGILFASRGDYEMAIADFTEAIRLDPNMSAAYMLRGRALFASVAEVTGIGENFGGVNSYSRAGKITEKQSKVYDQAIADFNQALRLDPNNATIYVERGNAYNDKEDFDQAIADHTQAIRLDPNYAVAYSNRGYNYAAKGEYDRAITDYNQAIRLNPDFASGYRGRAFAYSKKGDHDRAIADDTQAIRLEPNDADTYYARASSYFVIGEIDKAIADLTQAIRLDPNYATASTYAVRGVMRRMKDDTDGAIADFEAALRIDPNHADARKYLLEGYNARALAYYQRGDLDRAIADLEAALRIDPNYADAKKGLVAIYMNRAMAYRQRGDLDRTIADIEAALRINPNDADVRKALEGVRQQRGR